MIYFRQDSRKSILNQKSNAGSGENPVFRPGKNWLDRLDYLGNNLISETNVQLNDGGGMARELTEKQRRVLNYIRRELEERGYPPTIREINREVGLGGPNSVKKILDSLERKGHIRRRARQSRAIELIGPSRPEQVMVPLVGRVAAGSPVLAEENIEGYYSLDRDLCRCRNPFLLRVRGDSMREAHILDGDLVLVRPQAEAENGEIAVVMVGDEATVKRLFKEPGRIVLKPENPEMQPIVIAAQEAAAVSVLGKVIAVLRYL
jgi:repressor LexA